MCGDARRCAGVDIVDAPFALHDEHLGELVPQCGGPSGWPSQETRLTGVRLVVVLNERRDVDRVPPVGAGEPAPGFGSGPGHHALSSMDVHRATAANSRRAGAGRSGWST